MIYASRPSTICDVLKGLLPGQRARYRKPLRLPSDSSADKCPGKIDDGAKELRGFMGQRRRLARRGVCGKLLAASRNTYAAESALGSRQTIAGATPELVGYIARRRRHDRTDMPPSSPI